MTIQPRDYQLEALDAILSKRSECITNQLVSLPTGTGKTIIFGLLAKELNTKTLIIAHRQQLIKQAAEKISLVWPKASIGVCMSDRNDLDAQIVIASIQTASQPNRLLQLKEQGFSLCVVDECHHASSPSYRKLLQELGFLDKDSNQLLVGVTATAQRAGGGLAEIFQEVVFERSIGTMIKAGYLSDIKGKRILTSTNLDNISTSQGDFVEHQLSEACNTPQRNELIVGSFLEHCIDRKGIAFTCDVQHAIDLADTFKNQGINAEPIYGIMPNDEKDSILSRFGSGEIQVLTNCALLVEGYDEPAISTVLMCRPTRSQSLYIQSIGRGTRLYPGKTDCLVLDFCDNFHDIENIATLEKAIAMPVISGKESEEYPEETIQKEKIERHVFVGQQIIGDFDLLNRSRFAWVPVGDNWHLQLSPDVSLWLKKDDSGYMPTIHHENEFDPLVTRSIGLDYAMGVAEDWARRNKTFESWASKDATWRYDSPSEKQIETLLKMGCDPAGLTKGETQQLISQKINERNLWKMEPATAKQRFFLSSKGFKVPSDLTKGIARDLIGGIKYPMNVI